MTHSKLNVSFIISVMCGYLIIFDSVTLAEHFNKRPKGKHGPGPGQNELILKKSDSENFKFYGVVIVKGSDVPSLFDTGKNVFLYYQWFPKDITKKKWFDHIGVSISRNSGSTWDNTVGLEITDIPQRLLGRQGRPMDPAAVSLSLSLIHI